MFRESMSKVVNVRERSRIDLLPNLDEFEIRRVRFSQLEVAHWFDSSIYDGCGGMLERLL